MGDTHELPGHIQGIGKKGIRDTENDRRQDTRRKRLIPVSDIEDQGNDKTQ
jgi:hypothetical protein